MGNTVRTISSGPTVFTCSEDFITWVRDTAGARPSLPVLAVIDPAVTRSDQGRSFLDRLKGTAHLHCVPPATDEADLVRTSTLTGPVDVVLGIGGGAALDTAKLVPALWDPGHRMTLLSRSRAGHVVLRDKPEVSNVLALVPTTLGTGSETGMNACISIGSRKRLVSGPQLQAHAVLLDSGLTASLPKELVLAGSLEAIFRLSTPLIMTRTPRRSSDTLALASIRALAASADEICHLAKECPDGRSDLVRQEIAELSSFSQSGWSSIGRDSYGTLPWIIASELSMVAGISKMKAVAAILPAYWCRVEAGDTRFGHASRLREVSEALSPGTTTPSGSAALANRLSHWGLTQPFPPGPQIIHQTSQQISRGWGGWPSNVAGPRLC